MQRIHAGGLPMNSNMAFLVTGNVGMPFVLPILLSCKKYRFSS